MTRIKIDELCNNLKSDVNEKSLFFKELTAPEFLKPFYTAGLFSLTDEASFWQCKYFQRIYAENTASLIIEIINKNLEIIDINEIDCSTYFQLTKLIENFDLETLKNLNLKVLLDHNESIELTKCLYKNNEILKYKKLLILTIKSLLKYDIEITSYRNQAKLRYEIFYLSELLNNEATKENFKIALSQDFVFDLLITKYDEVYHSINKKNNDILDVYSMQSYNIDEIEERLKNEYRVENILDIIVYFLCVNVDIQNDKSKITKLLTSKIYMLRKLGLYFILRNLDKNIDLLKVFFEKINAHNIYKVSYICLYELVKILSNIHKIEDCAVFNPYLETYLNMFPNKYEKTKYNVLHGLKEHPIFKEQFYELKEKYHYERENPGLYWQTGVGGWVNDVSPINEEDFRSKTVSEQIEYINSEIDYKNNLVQIDENTVEEINERGLLKLFTKIISENVNMYLEDDSIFKLNKKPFINAVIQVLSQNIENITSLNRAILFIDNIFKDTSYNKDEFYLFLEELIEFNTEITKKRHNQFSNIFKYIIEISKNDYNETSYKESDWGFYSLNTIHGRNFLCYSEHLCKIKKLNNKDKEFLDYIFQEKNSDRFCSFYYYLGMNYQYYSVKFKELRLREKAYMLKDNAKKCFLNGYLSYFKYIEGFKELKNIILEAFINEEIPEGEVRARFVRMLLELKLIKNEDSIYEEFSKYFSEDDFDKVLNQLRYRETTHYSKENVMKFWEATTTNATSEITLGLLEIFNKYNDFEDVKKYKSQLINLIKKGFPKQLYINNSIEKFLEKLLFYLQKTHDCVTVYQLAEQVILSMRNIKYLYQEITIFKDILEEFKNLDNLASARVLANKMYETPCLKFYMINLKNFL